MLKNKRKKYTIDLLTMLRYFTAEIYYGIPHNKMEAKMRYIGGKAYPS